MNIKNIATTLAITAGLGLMSLSTAQADERESRYYNYGEQRHQVQNNRRENRALRHQARDNRLENKAIRHQVRENRWENKALRHQAREQRRYNAQREHRHNIKRVRQHGNYKNQYVRSPLEHRYLHKNGIPHRNTLGAAHPHKNWRKQHQLWDYARYNNRGYQNKFQVRLSRNTEHHNNRYIY